MEDTIRRLASLAIADPGWALDEVLDLLTKSEPHGLVAANLGGILIDAGSSVRNRAAVATDPCRRWH